MAIKVKNFVIQAKINEQSKEVASPINQSVNITETQKEEILEDCKELIEKILEKKASRI